MWNDQKSLALTRWCVRLFALALAAADLGGYWLVRWYMSWNTETIGQGLREGLPTPEIVVGELDLDGAHAGLPQLPRNLEEALETLKADEVVTSWFSPAFLATFEAIKRDEYATVRTRSLAEQCAMYTEVY